MRLSLIHLRNPKRLFRLGVNFLLCIQLAFGPFVFRGQVCYVVVHFLHLFVQLSFGIVYGLHLALSSVELEVKFGKAGLAFHQVSVGLYVGLLFLLVAIDPDLSSVFFRSNLLILLHYLVQELLSLNFVLLLKRLVRHRQVFVLALSLEQSPSFNLELFAIRNHHLILFKELILHVSELFLLSFELVLSLLPQIGGQLKISVHLLKVSGLFAVH